MSKRMVIVAVSLPLLVIAFGIMKSEYQLNQPEWRFSIKGYDPRDLLRGRYLNYSIDFQEEFPAACDTFSADCCLCLTRRGIANPPGVTRMLCGEAKACDGFIAVQYLRTLNQYYIPEAKASEYERLLQDKASSGAAEIILSVDNNGVPSVKQIEIDKIPIERAVDAPRAKP
jgi:hypothetical protein